EPWLPTLLWTLCDGTDGRGQGVREALAGTTATLGDLANRACLFWSCQRRNDGRRRGLVEAHFRLGAQPCWELFCQPGIIELVFDQLAHLMKRRLSTLPTYDKDDDALQVVIETPKGSHNKYDYNPNTGCFELAKVLPEGMTFPYDFGLIPSTLG